MAYLGNIGALSKPGAIDASRDMSSIIARRTRSTPVPTPVPVAPVTPAPPGAVVNEIDHTSYYVMGGVAAVLGLVWFLKKRRK